ncbi:MAG TPA: ribosome biogenesis GTPase Der [Bacteroidota bacterium]|nr:ribosome biogenesis GTPase Der [Bacteroidota bacterium]
MEHHLLAIVGRPNVGKSTLFNRIVGHRRAIVNDMPGVTRDRHYASAEWAGKQFTLVDTGGFVPASEDVFEAAIREQVSIAIREADGILFVVDAQDGALPSDREIAEVLRKSEKPVFLIVNKADSAKAEDAIGEFYALGLGEPIPASALLGRKIGDLLDAVTAAIGKSTLEEPEEDRLRIAVIGKPNVGKSSFVNALLGEDRHIVTNIPGTTRDPIDATLRFHGEEIILVDTAGLKRRSKIKENVEFYSTLRTLKSIERCSVAVILLDASQGLEHQDLRIIETTMERHRPAVIAVNKWDLIEKDSRTAALFEKALKERLRVYDFLPVVFISALDHQRVFKVLDLAKAADAEQRRRISTSELNATLGEEIRQRPPSSRNGKEIKVNYITQVKTVPPVFAFFCNNPALIDEGYRRFLENRLREHYAFPGVPIVLSFKRKSKREARS